MDLNIARYQGGFTRNVYNYYQVRWLSPVQLRLNCH